MRFHLIIVRADTVRGDSVSEEVRFSDPYHGLWWRGFEVVPTQSLKHGPNQRHVLGRIGTENDEIVHVGRDAVQATDHTIYDLAGLSRGCSAAHRKLQEFKKAGRRDKRGQRDGILMNRNWMKCRVHIKKGIHVSSTRGIGNWVSAQSLIGMR